jgi:hypothetical protein
MLQGDTIAHGSNERSACRLNEAEAILDEAIPELTDLRSKNAHLTSQVCSCQLLLQCI